MKYRQIPYTKLRTSVLVLGSGALHRAGSKTQQQKIMRIAIDLGINHIDFSYNYGEGKVESIAGECLSDFSRSKLIISSKAFFTLPGESHKSGLSKENIDGSVRRSLKKLKMDYLDLFYCHRFDPEIPMNETIQCISELIEKKKIRYWGVSHWPPAAILLADQLCLQKGWPRPVVAQAPLSLLADRCSPLTLIRGNVHVSPIAYSPLSGGILSGKYNDTFSSRKAMKPSKKYSFDPQAVVKIRPQLVKFEMLCRKYKVTASQAALLWVIRQPIATCAISGVTSESQLQENVAAVHRRLPRDFWTALGRIF